DSAIVKRIISLWPGIDSQARNNLMNLMISRRTWIPFILDAVEAGIIDSRRIGAYQARQIRAFGEPGLDRRVEEIQGKVLQWGMMDYDKEVFNKWRRQLSEEQLSRASLANGLEIFRAVCGVCHQLNGEGGTIGPDLTGSARDNLEYLLENILTPSATVADEYRQLTVTLKDGRIVGGTEKSRSAKVLQMQTVTGVVNVDLSEVVREEKSDLSVMPEGLLDAIGEEQARDLIAFLMQK
ncbi:MAG: c-type cytochrome, partial [Verrucomicrobiae bacterium]|nr:c-type cytochrome [Verrucomicrobiae bacterium]